jgi:hypothetical protein
VKIDIIGVYPVEARELCHLVELWIHDLHGNVNVEQFTQEVAGEPKSNWQAPYDERVLNEHGTAQVGDRFPPKIAGKGSLRLAFFFHYLDLEKPLLSPAGPVSLPAPADQPERLDFLEYEEP